MSFKFSSPPTLIIQLLETMSSLFFIGMELDGKAISVAISNPPAKKPDHQLEVRSLGGGFRDAGSRGRGRSQVKSYDTFMERLWLCEEI